MERRVEAQAFLDRCGGSFGGGEEPAGVAAGAENRADGIADLVDGGFVPGIEQQDRRGDELILGERAGAILGGGHGAEQVVAPGAGAGTPLRPDEGGELAGRLVGRIRDGARRGHA